MALQVINAGSQYTNRGGCIAINLFDHVGSQEENVTKLISGNLSLILQKHNKQVNLAQSAKGRDQSHSLKLDNALRGVCVGANIFGALAKSESRIAKGL